MRARPRAPQGDEGDEAEEAALRLRTLGLPVEMRAEAHPAAFLPGVWIDAGVLYVSPGAVIEAIYHEAGHLAVIPSRFRPLARPGSLFHPGCPVGAAMSRYVSSPEAIEQGPDHWLLRACLQCGEEEAIAWSYAAALATDLPPGEIFTYRYPGRPKKNQPFQGEGGEVMARLRMGMSPGIHGLHHGGMCLRKRFLPDDERPVWPRMLRWVQD